MRPCTIRNFPESPDNLVPKKPQPRPDKTAEGAIRPLPFLLVAKGAIPKKIFSGNFPAPLYNFPPI